MIVEKDGCIKYLNDLNKKMHKETEKDFINVKN